MHLDLRRHRRYKVRRSWIRASWLDRSGTLRVADVSVLNISEGGIAIESPEPLREFAVVHLRSAAHGLEGSAVVRRCKLSGLNYVVGLEFQDIVWTPPPEPVSSLISLSGRVLDSSATEQTPGGGAIAPRRKE
jgi:hypothetical protein